MKSLAVDYSMSLSFSSGVTDHYFLLRCVPISRGCQTVLSRSLDIQPAVSLLTGRDVFGNVVYRGHCFSSHDSFSFRANATVHVHSEGGTREACQPFYKYPTHLASCSEEMEEFLFDSLSGTDFLPLAEKRSVPSKCVIEFARTLLPLVNARILYTSGSTTVRTTAAEAFAARKGVCQDYAHVFIALCRRAGIAARYVCGMSKGEGATHAWTEVFVPDAPLLRSDGQPQSGTWRGIDPTRNKFTDDDYVILAVGRDFSDCQVDRGVFCGSVEQRQSVFVKTDELEPPIDAGLFTGHSVSGGADLAGQQQET